MQYYYKLLINYLLTLAFVINTTNAGDRCTKETCLLNKDVLKFFLLGDWGGMPVWPYFTYGQNRVAKAMGEIGSTEKTDFQLALGDNFYIVGVRNAHDKRFSATFENIYKQDQLIRTPWYALLGNHDHNGNIQAQIDYSKKSVRWTMPSPYYTVNYQLQGGTKVEIVIIDTVILCGQTKDGQFDSTLGYLVASSSSPKGPTNPEDANKQWQWIDNQLQASQAHYLIVAGHYPVYSVADHGPTRCLVDKLNPMLLKHNVTAYLSGHDHNLQHLQVRRNNSLAQPLHYVLSGGGAFLDSSNAHERDVPAGSLQFSYPGKTWYNFFTTIGFTRGAFVYSSITPQEATFKFYTGKGKELHSFNVNPRF